MGNRNFTEKECLKYVLATLDSPTMYLRYLLDKRYALVDDIEAATKTLEYKVAQDLRNYYYNEACWDKELVIIPVKITYELIKEDNL